MMEGRVADTIPGLKESPHVAWKSENGKIKPIAGIDQAVSNSQFRQF
jgi:hypothetical protein